MERPANRDDVAVFVDFENVYVSVREKFDASPNFEIIMDRCEDYGRIVLARAYADWYRYPRVTSALFANGVEPMYVPTYYYDRDMGRTGRPIKNSVDIHLCIDAMRTLFTQPNIRKFVLVTGDRDFIPLVNAIRQHGKDVIIIGIGGAASSHLAQSADEFLFYEQIADLKPTSVNGGRSSDESRRSDERREKSERSERGKQERASKQEAAPIPEPVVDEPVDEPIDFAPTPVEPMVEAPTTAPNPYETLVDAVKLARQRGFVVNLGSLKVVMRELDSNFHESKVKDANGRGFSKFKEFVKEAERQGKVQIFTNGTVTEVFLAGEDPKEMSQFAEDLISQQAERELENELAQAEQAREASETADVSLAAPEPIEMDEIVEVRDEPMLSDIDVPQVAAAAEEPPQRTFGDREWEVFRASMSQFGEPVRFADIFNALRGLRNQEVMELTNNELKELVKQGINRGILQRTGRGARAYYRLSSQYRVPTPETRSEPEPDTGRTPEATETVDTAATETTQPKARRRARLYSPMPVLDAEPVLIPSPDDDLFIPSPVELIPAGADAELTEATTEQAAEAQTVTEEATPASTPVAEAEAAPKPRRRARRKPAADTSVEEAPTVPPEATTATTSRSRSRKATAEQAAPEPEPTDEAKEGATKRRRRRKKPAAENGGESTEG